MRMYDDAGYSSPSDLDLVIYPKITQTSATSVNIDLVIPNTTPTSYGVTVQRLNTDGTNLGSPTTVNKSAPPPLSITNLTPAGIYKFTVIPKNGSTAGNGYTAPSFTLSTATFNGSYASNPLDPTKITSGKSYLTLSNNSTVSNKYSLAYKNFDAITLPTATNVTSLPAYAGGSAKSYTDKYYSFGTSVYMDSEKSSSGIGFFVDELGKKGYFIIVETTVSSSAKDRKSVRICKVDGGAIQTLKDTQRNATTTFEGVYGGKQYNIDVRVKVSGQSITINAYVNGFKISVTDTNGQTSTKSVNYILPPTKSIALLCGQGTAAFDYVYGTDILKEKYDQSDSDPNLYIGQFSDDLLNIGFGDIIYDAKNSASTLKSAAVDDFGTVVREIFHVTTKLSARPAYPLKWSTGGNKAVNIIGQTISNFNAEAYVLNNASTTVPLNDGNEAMFYLFGNTLGQSGTLEYSTDESEDYSNKEPVIFESKWLQTIADVKNLANWIKTKVINRGKIIDMIVFGNPLISVGDIISVKYTYQGFSGTEKMIVTNVNLSYNQGLETSITARTL